MPYIICNEKCYLKQNKDATFSVVTKFEDATKWRKIQSANNVCENMTRNKKYHDYGFEVKYALQENKVVHCPAKPIELDYDILEKVKELSEFTKQLEERRVYLLEQIQNIDLEIVDIEHAAEFYNLNAAQGYKLYKLLHDSRVNRRKFKDELQKIEYTLNTSMKSTDMDKLEKSIIGLDTRKYEPRINKELFGV